MPTFTVFKGSNEGKVVESQTTRPDIKGDEVYVKITASGLCGTDEHYRHTDMALGHEGAGVVEDIGPDVKTLKKGDRVGWGYQHDSCRDCEWCLTGRETFCEQRAMYSSANLDQGSMGSHAVWKAGFLFKIPEGLSDADAAPLMCGGATVYNALRMYDVQPDARVGVIGIGGLGHLAIQFAAKMGCDVVVFSNTEGKKDEALKLGASKFVATKGIKAGELDIGRKLDALLVTASVQPDWKLILPAMAPDSKVFLLTVSPDDLVIPYMALIASGISIQGSLVAARAIHRQMLAFAAHHQIKPMNVEYPMTEEGITEAFDTLRAGNMRYRGVLIPQ
ncbi:GroES-like protein [Pleomassaria siparia CBS 279.74]|uniref:GroES-like protein n=1 Tax=Pleomassaria siparia CBS 279.74 TaxID=1314801 RepID=A0A6G1K5X5_9PLEO|nr:GroES-like protein [Pleomassaria siparia CBS 279.74]